MKRHWLAFLLAGMFPAGAAAQARGQQVFIEEGHLAFELPAPQWTFSRRSADPRTGVVLFLYTRGLLLDRQQPPPNLTIALEKIPAGMDLAAYSAALRASMQVPFRIEKVFTREDGPIRLRDALGYEGRYQLRGVERVVRVVHAQHRDLGIQIIADAPAEAFPAMAPEFAHILKSLAFK